MSRFHLNNIKQHQSDAINKDEIEKQIEKWKNKLLNKFICPISHTFDKNSIEEWLKSKNTCPITRIELKSKNLILNHTLRSSINENIEKFIKH
ncbi:hypothetical protein ABK040_000539 [Willaertia magna]